MYLKFLSLVAVIAGVSADNLRQNNHNADRFLQDSTAPTEPMGAATEAVETPEAPAATEAVMIEAPAEEDVCVGEIMRGIVGLGPLPDVDACCAANPDVPYCPYHNCMDPETGKVDESKSCDCSIVINLFKDPLFPPISDAALESCCTPGVTTFTETEKCLNSVLLTPDICAEDPDAPVCACIDETGDLDDTCDCGVMLDLASDPTSALADVVGDFSELEACCTRGVMTVGQTSACISGRETVPVIVTDPPVETTNATTPVPSEPETTTTVPSVPETTTTVPSKPETTTTVPSEPETTTSASTASSTEAPPVVLPSEPEVLPEPEATTTAPTATPKPDAGSNDDGQEDVPSEPEADTSAPTTPPTKATKAPTTSPVTPAAPTSLTPAGVEAPAAPENGAATVGGTVAAVAMAVVTIFFA